MVWDSDGSSDGSTGQSVLFTGSYGMGGGAGVPYYNTAGDYSFRHGGFMYCHMLYIDGHVDGLMFDPAIDNPINFEPSP
jgi:prepilin-type processing-associated H-X9-DG protein